MNMIFILVDRIRTESPRFFVVLRWAFGALAVAGWAIKWLIAKDIWSPDYEAAINELCGYAGTAATAIWGTSFFPVKDKAVVVSNTAATGTPATPNDLIGSRDKDDR